MNKGIVKETVTHDQINLGDILYIYNKMFWIRRTGNMRIRNGNVMHVHCYFVVGVWFVFFLFVCLFVLRLDL